MTNYRLFPASERGHVNYGWLDTYYTFSFGEWYNPEKIHFGKLRVLNDDTILPYSGFDFHSHKDMEIITVLLNGTLEHIDSMGNTGILYSNEVQVMSAGTGIFHSEKNNSNEITQLFQIWIFPDKKGHTPRYQQKNFYFEKNKLQILVSPNGQDNSLSIHQNAFISRIKIEKNKQFQIEVNDKGNGIFLMVIDGKIVTNNIKLNKRDAIGYWDIHSLQIDSTEDSDILIIEVPMN